MSSAPQHSPAKLRRRARDTEYRHAIAGTAPSVRELRTSQGDVWQDIAETASYVGGASDTGAFDSVYAYQRAHIEQWLHAFPVVDQQVGVVVSVGGRPLALDVIDSPRLFARVHGRLLRGYVLDAIERMALAGTQQAPRARRRDAHFFLDRVQQARRVHSPTVGRGQYAVLTGDVVGGELVDGGRVAHLSAFPLNPDARHGGAADGATPDVAPPSRRRHHRRGGDQ